MLSSSVYVISAVQDGLCAALQRDAEKHYRLEQRGSAPAGFLLRVNGAQLQSAVAARDRKRLRSEVDEPAPVKGARASSAAPAPWPCIVLTALEAVLKRAEGDGGHVDGDGATSPIRRALTSVTGVEVRHCELSVANVCNSPSRSGSGDGSAEAAPSAHAPAPTLADLLLSPGRLWRHPAHGPSCSASAFVRLTTLDVECNALGDAGLRLLCSGLARHLPGLRRLLLASNGITAAGLIALADFARTQDGGPPPPLETLGLTNNPIGTSAEVDVTQEVWCDAFRAVVSPVAATLRRLHLNHAALDACKLACVLGVVLTCAVETQPEPRVFDMLYVRENKLADSAEVLQRLHDAVGDAALVDDFLRRHVSM